MYTLICMYIFVCCLLNSQLSGSDSEEEHDIDPSIHDNPMYTSLPSSHGNNDGKDHGDDDKVDDMTVTAKGRFIVPTSTMPHIRRSIDLVGVSQFSLDCGDDEIQSTGVCEEDDKEVMQPSQDDLSTSSLPGMPIKVSPIS